MVVASFGIIVIAISFDVVVYDVVADVVSDVVADVVADVVTCSAIVGEMVSDETLD